MKLKTLFCIPIAAIVLVLYACQTTNTQTEAAKQEARWYNVNDFKGIDSIGANPYDLEFDIAYSGIDGDIVRVKNCLEVSFQGDSKIAEREFARWDLLKSDCEAAKRFYGAPENAVSYWPPTFDLSLLKTFPSTSIPYLGGQGLHGRSGNLAEHESTLTLIESGEHSVKVSYDGIVVNYVVVARGDFNRDGYQDLFVRMDWYIEDAFGDGHDWVALTKLSPNAAPMMLWRK
ncbi:hypothetical protein [Agarivorans gilvus]|uniref:Lipoprotein n=1 Tax=Agarivorans gilvus TaxID=680279 RepID=A0ABQ1I3U6_9ALTE|nr:hypothetical protein [Agarivorans gilvus]GGB13757.1 hypothetical protein GCM10007414_28950 [Agarivorans gilvus]